MTRSSGLVRSLPFLPRPPGRTLVDLTVVDPTGLPLSMVPIGAVSDNSLNRQGESPPGPRNTSSQRAHDGWILSFQAPQLPRVICAARGKVAGGLHCLVHTVTHRDLQGRQHAPTLGYRQATQYINLPSLWETRVLSALMPRGASLLRLFCHIKNETTVQSLFPTSRSLDTPVVLWVIRATPPGPRSCTRRSTTGGI